jgi:hypothetical protein
MPWVGIQTEFVVAAAEILGECVPDQQRGEPLHPPVHAHVIDVDAPLDQEFLPRHGRKARSADASAPPK